MRSNREMLREGRLSAAATTNRGGGWLRAGPRIALYLFLFSINFEVLNLFEGGQLSLSAAKVLGLVYTASVVFFIPIRMTPTTRNAALALLAFLVIATVSSTLQLDGASSRVLDGSTLSCFGVFVALLCHQHCEPKLIERGLLAFVAGAILCALLSYFGVGVSTDSDGRRTLFGDNQNVVGFRMAIAIAILVNLALTARTSWLVSVGAISITSFPLVLIGQTGSRSAFIALALAFFVSYLNAIRSVRRFLILSAISAILAGVTIRYLLFDKSSPLFARLTRSLTDGDVAGRDYVWSSYLSQLERGSSYLLGFGYSGFENISFALFGRFVSPHNVILEVLLISGAVGLLFFVVFHVNAFGNAARLAIHGRYALPFGLLMIYLVALLTNQTLNVKLFWVVLAFAFARAGQLEHSIDSGTARPKRHTVVRP